MFALRQNEKGDIRTHASKRSRDNRMRDDTSPRRINARTRTLKTPFRDKVTSLVDEIAKSPPAETKLLKRCNTYTHLCFSAEFLYISILINHSVIKVDKVKMQIKKIA